MTLFEKKIALLVLINKRIAEGNAFQIATSDDPRWDTLEHIAMQGLQRDPPDGMYIVYTERDRVRDWTVTGRPDSGKFILYVAFGQEAGQAVETKGWEKAMKLKSVSGDIDIREFNTEAEMNAYILGIQDQAGWMDEGTFQWMNPPKYG